MNKKFVLILLSVAIVAFLVIRIGLFLKVDNPEVGMVTLPAASKITQAPAPAKTSIETADPTLVFQEAPEPDVNFELKRVATLYEQTTEYPDYSIPLSSNQHLLNTNQNYPVERSYDRNGNQGGISINLDQFRYEEGDQVSAEAVIQGTQGFKSDVRKVYAMLDDETISFESVNMADGELYYHASFSTRDRSGEQNFKFFVEMQNGDKLLQTVPFEVFSPIGEVTGVGSTSVKNNELIIPVKIRVDEAGYFRLSGNFVHVETGRPIAHLQGKEYLRTSGSNTIDLKVYGKHFTDSELDGDFALENLQLMQQPTVPGPDNKTQWGKEREEPLIIKDVKKNQFSETPYKDPLIAERLEFLNKISNNP